VTLLAGKFANCTEPASDLCTLGMAGTTESARGRKGKNFSTDEERQVCRSVLHISQDPIAGNGQRKEAFWECITTHYNQNKPIGGGERPSRSLETKWGIIKHDVAKFIGVHKQVSSCRESGSSPHDVLQNALKMSSFPTPQNSSSPPPTLYITSALPPYSQNKGPTVGRSKYKGPTAARPLALSSGAKRLV
jgi:hypothetical protein